MERQGHDYTAASAMAYAQQQRQAANMQQQQQQQQFGFHPQHQQFPSSMHGPPFIPPGPGPAHPPMQQFPYHHALQQQQQPLPQLHPHAPPPPHLLLQQQHQGPPAFPSHYPPSLVPSPFYDSAPLPVAPPSDPDLHKRIDKLVEYAVKNGPDFEAMICEKQRDNPSYSFLFGGEGHGYYRYKLWLSTRPPGGPFNPPFPSSSMPMIHPPPNPMMNPSPLNASPMNPAGIGSSPSMLGPPPFQQFYDQQHHHQHPQSFALPGRPEYDQSSNSFKGPSGPLPSDIAMELSNVLNNLNGTKESIKGAKLWFMQRSPFAPALAEALRDRVFALDEVERQLHIIYLANDILFDSLNRRTNGNDLDSEALALKPVLGSMLARIYHNPQSNEEYRKRLQQMVEFWASKTVYDQDTISSLKGEMIGGLQTNPFPGASKDLSSASAESVAGVLQTPNHVAQQWQADRLGSGSNILDQDRTDKHAAPAQSLSVPLAAQQFLPNPAPPSAFPGSMAIPSSVQPANQAPGGVHLLPPPSSSTGEQLPPYPLFPPGLIPGMVRKMQIGSGVPYSPLSPLDIPTIIPPSTVPPSEILQRVSKFFKEIGEVNPSEGPMNSDSRDEDDEYDREFEREPAVRKGGACIPPPPNLQVDPETGTYADGTVERKPGSSGSGRLGLGATANPNEGEKKVANIQNVFAVIKGSEEPDRCVLLGNHRDAWTYGAVDPSSGTAALLDIARRFSVLLGLGWKPRRTIILCSWDAEEFGMIGSTEWVEQNLINLGSKAVAYLNVDCAAQGPGFFVGSTPQLDSLILEVTKKVKDPDSEGVSIYENWAAASAGSNKIQRLSGVDSDFAPFVQHAGVPSIDMYYGKDFPVYHTAFDSYNWMAEYADPFFHRHVAVTGVWGLLALHLAGDPILPFNYVSYANELQLYKNMLSNLVDQKISLHPLTLSIEEFASAAKEADDESKKLRLQETEDCVVDIKKRALNDRLMLAEKGFLDADGLQGRQWFKHLVYGPSSNNERLNFFPGISDSITGSTGVTETERLASIQHEIWRVARAIRRAASALTGQFT